MQHWWDLTWLFTTAFALSAIAGMFRQLTLAKRRKAIDVGISGGYAGCTGLAISLVWHSYFIGNPTLLLGLCVSAALVGATSIDQVIVLVKKVIEVYETPKRHDE